jgi:uncharacterized protein
MTTTILRDPPRLRFEVRVQPRASRNRISGLHGTAIKVQLTAPPVDGAANAALLAFLAEVLDTSKSAIRLVAGEHSRSKLIEVETADPEGLLTRLSALVGERARAGETARARGGLG